MKAVKERGAGKTICPSEILSGADKKNKKLMDEVRAAAAKLASEGKIVVTSKGKPVDIKTHRGPVRLKLS